MKHPKKSQTNKGTGHGTGGLMQRTLSKRRPRLRLFPKPEWTPTPGAFGGKHTRDWGKLLVMKAFYGTLLRGKGL